MAVVMVEISESRNRFSSLKSIDVSSTLEERFFFTMEDSVTHLLYVLI